MTFIYIYSSLDRNDTDKKEKADNHDEREVNTRETPKAKSVALRENRIWGECLIYFAQLFWCCILRRYNPFMLIESSCSVDFTLQCGKAWNRNFVSCDFCNTFVLIRESGLCLFVKRSLQRINPSFRSNQLYKCFRLTADCFLSRNKIKFRHSFVSAQVFGLPSSTGPLGFPNKSVTT